MSAYLGRGGVNALAELSNAIVLHLPDTESQQWLIALDRSLRDGADLSRVEMRMRLLVLTDHKIGLPQIAAPDGVAIIVRVADLIRRDLDGDEPAEEEWTAARDDAWAASRAAQTAGAGSAARAARWAASGAVEIWYSAVRAAAARAVVFFDDPAWMTPAAYSAWRRIGELLLVELAAAPMALDLHRVEIRPSAD